MLGMLGLFDYLLKEKTEIQLITIKFSREFLSNTANTMLRTADTALYVANTELATAVLLSATANNLKREKKKIK